MKIYKGKNPDIACACSFLKQAEECIIVGKIELAYEYLTVVNQHDLRPGRRAIYSREASFQKAKMYWFGLLPEGRNLHKGAMWYSEAARIGNTDAMLMLALIHQEGGFRPDKTACLFHIKEAAKMGVAEAQNMLGRCYLEGQLEHNLDLAIKWFGKAAKQDFPPAMTNYAESVLNTPDPDYKAVVKVLKSAAKMGHNQAMGMLIIIYSGNTYPLMAEVIKPSAWQVNKYLKTYKHEDWINPWAIWH